MCPGHFVSWTFYNWTFGNWKFCILDVLYPGCSVTQRLVTGRLVTGRFVTGRYVTGHFVGVPIPNLGIVWWRGYCNHFYGVCDLTLARLEMCIISYFTYSGSEFSCGSLDPDFAPNLDPNLDLGGKSANSYRLYLRVQSQICKFLSCASPKISNPQIFFD